MEVRTMKKFGLFCMAIALVGIMTVGQASATPTLKLSDGVTTMTISDNGGVDNNSLLGIVSWNGIIGAYTITVVVGDTKPDIGSATAPILDFNIGAHSTTTSSTLTMMFSDTDFTFPGSGVITIGGTLSSGTTLTASAYFDTGNTLFGMGNQIGNTLTFTSNPFSGSTSGGPATSGTYSLTDRITLAPTSVPGQVGVVTADENLTVPEPATLLLLGCGLISLAGFARKKFRK
jgi:hypothetical protein